MFREHVRAQHGERQRNAIDIDTIAMEVRVVIDPPAVRGRVQFHPVVTSPPLAGRPLDAAAVGARGSLFRVWAEALDGESANASRLNHYAGPN